MIDDYDVALLDGIVSAANIPALLHLIALLLAAESERALTAEERLEQMTRERDEARAQLAELATKKEKP
jgi:hypothetical protein